MCTTKKRLFNSVPLRVSVREAYSSAHMGKKMELLSWKQICLIFRYLAKRSVRKMGQRRETWVTWAGPGHAGGSERALLVTARARQQLMYAGHRKAGLRRRRSHRDLCVVLT